MKPTHLALFALPILAGCSGPVWHPGDSDLLYSSNSEGNGEIYVMPAGTNRWFNLTKSPEEENNPVWSPDGSRILFQRQKRGGKIDIWVMDADGRDQRPLVDGPDHEYLPTWHPDGDRVTFVWSVPDSSGVERPGFHMVDLAGGASRPFSGVPLNTSAGVTWLADGASFVTTIESEETSGDLYVFDSENAAGRRITSEPGYEGGPAPSPDGKWLAFHHGIDDPTSTIEVCRIDGSKRRVVVADGLNYSPSWSPDGRWLVFVRQTDPANPADLDLYLVPVDGSAPPTVLVGGSKREADPSFRPVTVRP